MLKRKAWDRLVSWKNSQNRKALMLTGARQIGKTTLVRQFGAQYYDSFAELNFLMDSTACAIFDGPLDANTVITNLTAYLNMSLQPGRTLILLDEIQECPRARTAIKFLVEDGRFDYIETGSLLSVKTKQVPSYPVGFEEQYRMYPLDFEEYCLANGVQQSTIDMLREHFDEKKPVSDAVHQTMMRLFQSYIVVGGMPEVVQKYADTHDIAQVTRLQRDLLALYRQDIAKYAEGNEREKIRAIFDAVPSQLDDKNRRFMLADLSKTARQNRYASSFLWLADAGVTLPCYNVRAPEAPLESNGKRNLFKLFMNDVGLLCADSNAQFDILGGGLQVNMGSIVENFVAQELKAHGFGLHYFNGKRYGEVDFVVQSGNDVLPIEVKSGNDWAKHKALDNIMNVDEWNLGQAYVLCKGNVAQDGKIAYLPLYMSMFLEPVQLPERLPYEVDLSALED
ncbi:ATP-binding protein [Bifidobacterium panos]|uniref:ATPase n=1 Tax=Bifidobacterium panos TaxID=2675321 RepID=A0ABX1SY49_9BIFI|nr:ATP-binding protein [Bifidobacterium sp. DSM 109963]NMN02112.1 ATPase [Bifidobacterium sp. DSM 109963]